MPIYEFYCPDCNHLMNFLSKRIDTTSAPGCPHCPGQRLTRQVSQFALARGGDEAGGGEGNGPLGDLPIDEEASSANGYTVKIWDDGFSEQYPYYARIDVLFKFKRNRPRYSGEWSLDLMNILNRKNVRYAFWDNASTSIQYEYQNPFILNITYRIQF